MTTLKIAGKRAIGRLLIYHHLFMKWTKKRIKIKVVVVVNKYVEFSSEMKYIKFFSNNKFECLNNKGFDHCTNFSNSIIATKSQ